jgi:hypothetical protein
VIGNIGIILLIGIVKKTNGIMLVNFAIAAWMQAGPLCRRSGAREGLPCRSDIVRRYAPATTVSCQWGSRPKSKYVCSNQVYATRKPRV